MVEVGGAGMILDGVASCVCGWGPGGVCVCVSMCMCVSMCVVCCVLCVCVCVCVCVLQHSQWISPEGGVSFSPTCSASVVSPLATDQYDFASSVWLSTPHLHTFKQFNNKSWR